MMRKNSCRSHDHLFLLCKGIWFLWCDQFSVVAGKHLIFPGSISTFLHIRAQGFVGSSDVSFLWQCEVFAVFWRIWNKRNSRIFRNQICWCRFYGIHLLGFSLGSGKGSLSGVALPEIQWDWNTSIFLVFLAVRFLYIIFSPMDLIFYPLVY